MRRRRHVPFPFVVGLAFTALLSVVGACSSSTGTASGDAGVAVAPEAAPSIDASTSGGEAPADASTACTDPAFAGCTTFDDRTAEGADRTVTFMDFAYTPKCLRIKSGQSVVFTGDFDRHPLVTSCGPTLPFDHRAGMTPASFVLEAAGRYGYYCLDHGNAAGQVMSGSIDVVP